MRILTLIPGGISDQILFFPTLKTLKEEYPEAIIDVIVEPRSKNTYRVCKFVNEVLMFDFQDNNGLADYLNLLGIIRDREYELVITGEKNWIVSFLLWLDGIPTRIGYKTKNSWFLSNVVEQKTEQYTVSMYHDLLKALNIHSSAPELSINVPKEDIDWAESEQKRLNIKNTGYILIHGGASPLTASQGIYKIYPVPQWQRIIEDIQKKQPNLPVVLLCGPDDLKWTTEVLNLCPTVKVVSPPDIGKLAGIIAGANLMLCTDSAPMQLAVAVGTYTIALFGPTKAKKLLPPNSDRYIGIQSLSDQIADIPTDKILEQIWKNN
ncbi:MAG: glycosyltransferase family 9 protein [Cyanobacteria bacterium]|nr:glycosyltransferase family 9 protein [Cyanobacteria bacterium CG_2015-16_32_12]NCO76967.1 glycosyltransferase family 9 protein [Cyanobacteria bacterium CG_2015-22_32_23]NCQ03261.1 glycosyltransferase family 9 protein [Cyanobacteria bacterium CG_2015-09_32_10]NCQ42954.1 glycosyltransferase family 9 protein [Cyanobacteria bacterium CG_2015-04_32_10]NCS85051.1 glycosyltransferase family 9 protein [Cyanobacteria bacterium CG_2015-02_32_10]